MKAPRLLPRFESNKVDFMLKRLHLQNVGPSAEMQVPFGERLTVITGDNGLGKSFLLDVAWWALTRKWPMEVNPSLTGGGKAFPRSHAAFQPGGSSQRVESSISFTLDSKTKEVTFDSGFDYDSQAWTGKVGRPQNPGLVIYAMSDGSFALWDPARNYWKSTADGEIQDRQPAYVFNPNEIWHGLLSSDGKSWLSNGLIRDWASWQKENGTPFDQLKRVLQALSPHTFEQLSPGNLTRISVNDSRDMPTLRMPYGQDVPVVFLSAAIKRMVALGYFLTWAWSEHIRSSAVLAQEPAHQIIMLVDEVEAHLHPQWQRKIVPALLQVVGTLSAETRVQAVFSTHSPLVMASMEPFFDQSTDLWLDLDYAQSEGGQMEAVLTEREFERMGDASDWLTSEAFDMGSARSVEAEAALESASQAMQSPNFGERQARVLHAELAKVLPPTDPFWARWRHVAERKGWQL